jgi:hypothetical protein
MFGKRDNHTRWLVRKLESCSSAKDKLLQEMTYYPTSPIEVKRRSQTVSELSAGTLKQRCTYIMHSGIDARSVYRRNKQLVARSLRNRSKIVTYQSISSAHLPVRPSLPLVRHHHESRQGNFINLEPQGYPLLCSLIILIRPS